MELSRLWVGMLTRYLVDAGTNSGITLRIVIGGEEKLDEDLSNALQKNRGAGVANLYEVNVAGKNIIPEELEPSSISVIIRGRDAWRPEHLMVWGERRIFFFGGETEIIPLAIETDITTQISADASEGPSSLTLRSVDKGTRRMQINRLFMLMTTAGTQQESSNPLTIGGPSQTTGTDSPLQIQIVSEGHLVVLSEISDTPQDDLEPGSANFYSAPVIAPFTKGNLDNRSITLRILGRDDWEPASFFLFGLDDAAGRPEFLVPLVHLPEWPHGIMRADSTTGTASVSLSLLPEPQGLAPDDGGVVATLNSIVVGQERMIELLQKLVAK